MRMEIVRAVMKSTTHHIISIVPRCGCIMLCRPSTCAGLLPSSPRSTMIGFASLVIYILDRVTDYLRRVALGFYPRVVGERHIRKSARIWYIDNPEKWSAIYRMIKCPRYACNVWAAIARCLYSKPVAVRITARAGRV